MDIEVMPARSSFPHSPLHVRSRIPTAGTRALDEPRLHLVGCGDWTGPASATLIGVGRTAREGSMTSPR